MAMKKRASVTDRKSNGQPVPSKRAEPGRPTKLDNEVMNKVIEALREGATRKGAAEYAGITYNTLLNWLDRGQQEQEGPFFDFFVLVQAEEAELEVRLCGFWQNAASEDWRAAAEMLSRRREGWSSQPMANLNVTGENVLIVIPQAASTDTEWQQQVQQYLHGQGSNSNQQQLSPKPLGRLNGSNS
jgi:hypothetical protein